MSDTDKTLALILVSIILLSLFPVAGYLVILLLLSHLIRRNKFGEIFETLKSDLGLIFLLSSFGLSTLFTDHHLSSLAGFSVFLLQVLLYLIIRSYIKDQAQNFSIIRYLLFTSLIVSTIGIVQYYFASHMPPNWVDQHLYNNIPNRAFSTLYNPNVLGSYLIMVISIAMSGFQSSDKKYGRVVNSVILVAAYLCMLLTFSRGAWLGLAISVLIIFVFSKEKPYILAIMGITFMLAIPQISIIMNRINIGILADDSSNTYRHYLWTLAIKIFKENPVFGTGISTFGFSLPSHSNAVGYLVSHAHNIYLNVLAETGLLGFIAFFGYIGIAMYVSFKLFRQSRCRQTRNLSLGVMASFVGLLVHGNFDATLYLPQLSIFVWIIAAVARNLGDLEYVPKPAFSKLALTVKPFISRILLHINHR